MSAMKSGSIIVLLGLLLLFGGGCSETVMTEEFYQSYRPRPDSILEVHNPNGPVKVEGYDGENIEIKALKETTAGQAALERVEVYIEIDDIMTVETEHPKGEMEVSVAYEIKIPDKMSLGKIECYNGDIEVKDLAGNPELSTSNGNIEVKNLAGFVSARSSNGNLDISGTQGMGNLRTSNGDIKAEISALQNDLDIITSNGSITILLEPGLSATLEARTSNGTVSADNLDLEITEQEQTALNGKLNDGDYNININTSNGSIELDLL